MPGGGKAFADNSLTGLHLGFGLNVVADEYKSDVDVLGKVEYKTGGEKWTFDGARIDELCVSDFLHLQVTEVVNREGSEDEYISYKYTYTQNGYNITGESDAWSVSFSIQYGNTTYKIDGSASDDLVWNQSGTKIEFDCYNYMLTITRTAPVSDGHLTAALVDEIMETSETTSSNFIYGNKYAEEITQISTSGGTASAYLGTPKPLKARTNRIGGELKMSYFHNLTDHLVLGVDVCGTLNQKAKKNIGIDKFNYVPSGTTGGTAYKIHYKYDDDTTIEATYKNGEFTQADGFNYSGDTVTGFFKTVTDEDEELIYIPERTYTIESISTAVSDVINSNPGYEEIAEPDTSQYLQISNEQGGDVTFEKNKFNSRAAVVLGAQYKGWFAGIRGGVSYNQGKIHAKDATGTSTEDVSFASPFVGLHLMKSINMKGLENGHIYVTADVNVQNKQKLNMKGIKNFRQNSVNVSLGMTWQIN